MRITAQRGVSYLNNCKHLLLQEAVHLTLYRKTECCSHVTTYFYSKTNQTHQCIKFILFLKWHSTCFGRSFRPSSGVQDCTVHTATCICQTDTAVCLLASRQQYLLLYVQSWTPDDGRKDRPKHVECHFQNKINLIRCSIWLVLP